MVEVPTMQDRQRGFERWKASLRALKVTGPFVRYGGLLVQCTSAQHGTLGDCPGCGTSTSVWRFEFR